MSHRRAPADNSMQGTALRGAAVAEHAAALPSGGPRALRRPAAGVLLVCDFNAHGGTQTQVLELLAAMDRSRFRPRLATLNLDPALGRRAAALGVAATDLALRGALRPATLRALGRLARLVHEEGVRLVHGFLFGGNLAAAVAGRAAGVPYITSVRNLELWKRPSRVLASRWAHGGAAAVTFNSRHVRDLVVLREAIAPSKARVIANGLAPGELRPAPDAFPPGASPKLICPASLFPKKGHEYLLRAFVLVRERRPGAVLLLAGDGPERARLESRARDLGLMGSVLFAGHRPDAPALIAAADLCVLASLEEGLPNVLLEAMAAGVPQVATAVGGVPEAVEAGATGLLVPPHDPVLLAGRILKLVEDADLRARMSAASRDRFARLFGAARMAREHEALWSEVLAAEGAR